MSLPLLAHALAPYLPQTNGTTQSASLEGATLTAAVKGVTSLI